MAAYPVLQLSLQSNPQISLSAPKLRGKKRGKNPTFQSNQMYWLWPLLVSFSVALIVNLLPEIGRAEKTRRVSYNQIYWSKLNLNHEEQSSEMMKKGSSLVRDRERWGRRGRVWSLGWFRALESLIAGMVLIAAAAIGASQYKKAWRVERQESDIETKYIKVRWWSALLPS